MDMEADLQDFTHKFTQLTEANRRYIIGIQQALIFAQSTETAPDEYSDNENGETHETGTV